MQNVMPEAGLQGKRTVCDKAPPTHAALPGGSSERETKTEKSQARVPASWIDLARVAFC